LSSPNSTTPLKPSLALHNWLPVRIKKTSAALLCEWLYLGEKEFTEPFFDETISACRYANSNNRRFKSVSNLETMTEWAKDLKGIPPTAILFHVSRCGSTLLSQLLGIDKKNIVLSEVPFFDEILRLPLQQEVIDRGDAENVLQAALSFYGQQRFAAQQRLFIKTDSWHLHFYEQYRKLFPHVPFFLLYRHPLQVLHSQQKQRGIQSVPGLIEQELFGFTEEQSRDTNLDRYMANVVASYFEKMIRIVKSDPLAVAVDYADGLQNSIHKLYSLLQLPLEKVLDQTFAERCRFHAKRPSQVFEEEQKESEMPSFLATAFSRYEQLKAISGKPLPSL
jgi:hypothetical protein